MPIIRDWNLDLDVDMILRGQGADPAVLRQRSPQLIPFAEQALAEGRSLIEPVLVFRELAVKAQRHECLILDDGSLTGKLVPKHLGAATQLVVMVLTIGDKLVVRVSEVMSQDILYAMALDGLGSAAVEALGAAACRYVEDQATARGLKTTLPLSPGMEDWPVDAGQQQIFGWVDASQAGVRLTESWMMVPRKSTSAVMGLGKDIAQQGRPCDYCAMTKTCRYKQQYA